jgi:hypothetical protein
MIKELSIKTSILLYDIRRKTRRMAIGILGFGRRRSQEAASGQKERKHEIQTATAREGTI